jgi:hypothetical protein
MHVGRDTMKNYAALVIAAMLLFIAGCSGGIATSPVAVAGANIDVSHSLWGLWQGIIDPGAKAVEIVQLRTPEFHLNALPFLEPPALVNLTIETLQFNGNIIEADIGLRHPFLGLTEFTGFDVCGIFITSGTMSGFADSDIIMPGPGDTRILNPDGYSRWWNPAEFPVNLGTINSYNDGLLGTPDESANFNCTINGYKYFSDDLAANDPVANAIPANRGMFSAGMKNVRHYTLDMADGLVFNYAVDASWQYPQGNPPYEAPGDFGPGANRSEAWNIDVEISNSTLWNDGIDNGGFIGMTIDVYDHFNSELNVVSIESPGNIPFSQSTEPVSTSDYYSTFEIITDDCTPAEDSIEILVSVICEEQYGSVIPGDYITAYFTLAVPVADEEPQQDCLELYDVAGKAYSSFHTKTTQIIYDQTTWADWWAIANGTSFPPPELPVIDFVNEMVIAVTMGQFSTGGFYSTIEWACFDDQDDLEIYVIWHHPGVGCIVPMVFTQPWLAKKCERYDGDFYFTEEIDVYPCD